MDNSQDIQYPVPISWFKKNASWIASLLTILGIIGGVLLDRYLIQEKILLKLEVLDKNILHIEDDVDSIEDFLSTRVKTKEN